MSEAIEYRDRMEWNRVSALMALLCNINSDPKKARTFYPTDFNPYYAKKRKRANAIEVKDAESRRLFKEAFEGRRWQIQVQ
ncbi:MAG: hypothetical protein ABFD79_08945 [Phycisphaerales bacterium]